MLALTKTSRPATANGTRRAPRIRRATCSTAARPSTSSSRIANSSPPKRAAVSPDRRDEPHGQLAQELVAGGVPERVVDDLEAVDVEEQHGELGLRALHAREAEVEAVEEERAVGEVGERVVKGLVQRVADHPRVGQGEARVLGERQQGLLVVGAVAAPVAPRRHDEAADDAALLAHRRRHRGRRRGDDQAVLLDRAPAEPGARRQALGPDLDRGVEADARHEHGRRRVVGVQQPQAHDVAADELGGTGDDRVQHVVRLGAADDHPLEPREALEQLLALEHPDGHDEHARHAEQEVELLAREVLAAGAGDEQVAGLLGLQADDRDAAVAQALKVRALRLAGERHELGLGHRVGRVADRVGDGAPADDGDDLGLEDLGDVLDGAARRLLGVDEGGDEREELRELMGRPALGALVHQPSARTTSVWLWTPVSPRVRAISPYV